MSNNATRDARPTADDAATQAARAARAEKMAWVKAVGADPAISSSAARVAMTAALNLAYNKGCIRATRKHLGKLSGLSDATVKRAVAELAEQHYWYIDHTSGGANLYTLIPPDERLRLWLEEESGENQKIQRWLNTESRAIDNWLYAEKRFTQEWLDAEKRFAQEWLSAEKRFLQDWLDTEQQFTREWLTAEIGAQHAYELQIFNAVLDRCGNTDHAMNVARAAWTHHQEGTLPLEKALEMIAQQPPESFPAVDPEPGAGHLSTGVGSPATRGRVNVDPGVGSPEYLGRVNPELLTSVNEPSTSTYKNVKFEVSTSDASPAGRAPTGAPSGNAQETTPTTIAAGEQSKPEAVGCRLCDAAGRVLQLNSGESISLVRSVDSLDWDDDNLDNNERPFMCTHSLAGNMRELKRLVADCGEWAPAWTGYGEEIDGRGYDE